MEITAYRERVLAELRLALQAIARPATAIDFGSGDGYYCQHLLESGALDRVHPIDVVERKRSYVKPEIYGGGRLPFDDKYVDLAYAIDVLHHCADPLSALADLARVSRRWLLIKDHNCSGALGHGTLAVLDQLGNRRFGIASPGNYQRQWAWVHWIESNGFRRVHWRNPMQCHTGLLGRATNGLQFIGLWMRA